MVWESVLVVYNPFFISMQKKKKKKFSFKIEVQRVCIGLKSLCVCLSVCKVRGSAHKC